MSIEKDTLFSEVMHEMQKTRPWAILAAGAAIQVLTGLPAAWGVFQRPVMEEYGLSEQGAGYAFGVLIAFFGIGCVIGGFLQDKHGPRFAALWGTGLLCGGFFAAAALPAEKGRAFFGVFSIPAGLGTAFLYPSIQSCAQKWYKGRKGLATGVIGGAVGLSGAFLTVFVRTALRGFGPVQGIRGAFWAMGALTLPVCLAGSALLTDPPPEKPQSSQQGKAKAAPSLDLSPRQMLGTRQYWLCAGAVLISSLGAVMDVALSLASSLHELREADGKMSGLQLFAAGMRIGRDMIGTMSNTLILAFAGEAVTTLLLLMAYGWHSSQLFASDYAAIQVAQGVASTLGVVLGVPITSGICAALYRPLKR